MTALIVWALCVVGLTYGVTSSSIFAVPRILIARIGVVTKIFIYCSHCVSFWAGVGLCPLAPISCVLGRHAFTWWFVAPLSGFAAMGLVEVLKGVFPALLNNSSAFMQEQLEPLTVESADDSKEA